MIQFSNVEFYYPQQQTNLTLSIPQWQVAQGEKVFIHGPSGSGKSTLLNLLSGLTSATGGDLQILGQTLSSMSSRKRDQFRANNIGHIFQAFNLIPYLNAYENIRLARYFSSTKSNKDLDQEIEALLTKLNLAPEAWSCPTHQLSMGQQQRVAIARALINTPKLLIADEPTSSLDQKNRDLFMNLLMSIAEKDDMTLVFVSHDLSLSQYFSRTESLEDINQASTVSAAKEDSPCL